MCDCVRLVPIPFNEPWGYGAQWGYYSDSETQNTYSGISPLVLCGHRYYDPHNARWLTRDPIGYSGGINLYAFCGNNPVNYADPWGLCGEQAGDNEWDYAMGLDRFRRGTPNLMSEQVLWGSELIVSVALPAAIGPLGDAINLATCVEPACIPRIVDRNGLGRAGEKWAEENLGWTKNTRHIESMSETATHRVPDYLDYDRREIADVKNRAYVARTRQISDYILFAEDRGFQVSLLVREGNATKVSKSLVTLEKMGKLQIIRKLPKP